MGAVRNFKLEDFMAAVKQTAEKNHIQISSAEQADKSIQEYFKNLAIRDAGENPEEYEADSQTYRQAVQNCVNNILAVVQDGASQITKSFWGGARENGAQRYDVVDEYTNGELIKSTFGFDDDNDGQITGSEKEYEFVAGNYDPGSTKDRMNIYIDGKLTETVYGDDKNNDGFLNGDEITDRKKQE